MGGLDVSGKLIWPKINDKYCPIGCHLGMLCLMADFDSQNKVMFVDKLCLYHLGNMELKPALIIPAICLAVQCVIQFKEYL